MAKKGSLTTAHLVVAALVVLVVNAQLSWWISFFLMENRNVLELKRQVLELECRQAASSMELVLAEVQRKLDLFAASKPDASATAPEPLRSWQVVEDAGVCRSGGRLSGDGLILVSDAGGICVEAMVAPEVSEKLRHLDGPVELRPAEEERPASMPALRCPAPLDGQVVVPRMWSSSTGISFRPSRMS